MTKLNDQLTQLSTNLENWIPSLEFPERFPQFTTSQIKRLLWKRSEDPALASCCRMVGKQLYVNAPMFGLWMAGALPQQQEAA